MSEQYPYGAPAISGIIKTAPADFKVAEQLGFELVGQGEHLFLYIEKQNLTTMQLIEQLAADFSIHPRLIGHSGLKDKNAITRQWISLHLPGQYPQVNLPENTQYRILNHTWHNKKLRPGAHRCNEFEIIVRQVMSFPPQSIAQITAIQAGGFANYFGRQRFGRQNDNVEQALKHLSRRKIGRQKKGLYISALRSFLFNQVLDRRIAAGHWGEPIAGDVFMLRGTHSIFSDEMDEALLTRYHSLDISSSASLYGSGSSALADSALAFEEQVYSEYPAIIECLQQQEAKRQMRSLRVAVDDLEYSYDAHEQTLTLKVSLPAGTYFTSLLDHFVTTKDA